MRQRSQRFDSRQDMLRQSYEVFHYSDSLQNEVEVHNHDFYEVFFFLGGNISYWMEGQIYHPEPGDILLIDPMTLHRPIISKDDPTYERIVMWISKSYLESFNTDELTLTACFRGTETHLLHPSSVQRADITEKFGNLVREYYSGDYGASLYAEGLFMQIMVELNRLAISASKPHETEHSSPLVSRVLEYIGEHFNENLSLDGLAEEFFISKYHLSHEFSHAVGTSVYRYIMLKRLTAAKQMLLDDVAPGEVYLRCGFKDYTSFFRAFKAEFGISPRDFSVGT